MSALPSATVPVVSVVVPTLNRPRQLTDALASITGQSGIDLRQIEVIVVNDGGQPVHDVVDTARQHGLPVRLVTHHRRLGLPHARNTGIEHARGSHLAFLDDDDVFLPAHLATALSGLESGADVVATTCWVADRRVDPALSVRGAIKWDVAFDPELLDACNLFPVHTAVLRTVTASPTARFDTALPAIEDWDFWLRLTREHRYRVSRICEPTVVYHRLPQVGSMIGAVAESTAAMARFSAVVRSLWSRWPATTARAQRFRNYTAVMYWQVLGQLATGGSLNLNYYLHTIEALAAAWHDPSAETDLIDLITLVVKEDRANDHAA